MSKTKPDIGPVLLVPHVGMGVLEYDQRNRICLPVCQAMIAVVFHYVDQDNGFFRQVLLHGQASHTWTEKLFEIMDKPTLTRGNINIPFC